MPSPDAPLTLGTAGHIDHGKTALIGALTGRETDRLPEERERGISIELGYAPLRLPSGRRLSVVDVPGHERFVRTMVAGATGVDLFLLCVAADDGVMAQTREHLAVLRQLGLSAGVVAITKADLADPARAAAQLDGVFPEAPRVAVSARSRSGIDDLLAALADVAARVPPRSGGEGEPRLHADRSFPLRGIGTVVTGTLWSGSIARGDRVAVLPAGIEARVRSVEVHDKHVEVAEPGQRVALNLAGAARDEVARGDVVTSAGSALAPTWLVDARLSLEDGVRIERGTRVHVHHGTREAPARVVPIEGTDLVQLRLEAQLVPAAGDRLVLRQVAPPDTIGGGEVVDPRPRKHSRLDADPPPHIAAGEFGPDSGPKSPAGAGELDERAVELASLLDSDGFEPRADGELAQAVGVEPGEAARLWSQLERRGRAVRVAHNLHFAPKPLAELERRVIELCERDGATTIAAVRDELATSRRYAQALLEHLDSKKVTIRRGDAHVLRRR